MGTSSHFLAQGSPPPFPGMAVSASSGPTWSSRFRPDLECWSVSPTSLPPRRPCAGDRVGEGMCGLESLTLFSLHICRQNHSSGSQLRLLGQCVLAGCMWFLSSVRKPGKGRNRSASALISHIPPQCRRPRWHSGKESDNAGDAKDTLSVPGSVRSSGVGNGNPFQYSCLENPMDKGAWWAIVHGVEKSGT